MSHIYLPELAAMTSLILRAKEWQTKLSAYLTGLLTGNSEHAPTVSSPLGPEDVIAARSEEATAARRIDSEPDVTVAVVDEDGGLPDVNTTQPLSDDGLSETSSTGATTSALFNTGAQHNGLDMAAITAQLQVRALCHCAFSVLYRIGKTCSLVFRHWACLLVARLLLLPSLFSVHKL